MIIDTYTHGKSIGGQTKTLTLNIRVIEENNYIGRAVIFAKHLRHAGTNKYGLIKMDIESAEATVLTSLEKSLFFNTDIIVEVSNKSNANKIYKFLKKIISNHSLKKNFIRVKYLSDIPSSHCDGLLLISQTMGDKIF